jgi:hypothetical protein
MKWALWIGGTLVAVILIAAVIGWLLPVKHEARQDALINRPIDRVYADIANVEGYATWVEGYEPIKVRVEEAVPPSKFVTRIDDPDQPFGGTWTFTLAPEGAGTRVTIVEHGEVYNPIFRFMSRFVFGHTATMETFLRSLARRAP